MIKKNNAVKCMCQNKQYNSLTEAYLAYDGKTINIEGISYKIATRFDFDMMFKDNPKYFYRLNNNVVRQYDNKPRSNYNTRPTALTAVNATHNKLQASTKPNATHDDQEFKTQGNKMISKGLKPGSNVNNNILLDKIVSLSKEISKLEQYKAKWDKMKDMMDNNPDGLIEFINKNRKNRG